MSRIFLSGAFLAAAVLSVGACTSSNPAGGADSGPACSAFQLPAGTDLTTPTVSFKTDVMPVFQRSCALSSSCHGAATGSNNGILLGSKTVFIDSATLIAGMTTPSTELPTMNYVKPSDTANSYLMHKMDGDQCQFDTKCTVTDPTTHAPTCLVSMPSGSDVLDEPTRLIVRRWIAQGAQNN